MILLLFLFDRLWQELLVKGPVLFFIQDWGRAASRVEVKKKKKKMSSVSRKQHSVDSLLQK